MLWPAKQMLQMALLQSVSVGMVVRPREGHCTGHMVVAKKKRTVISLPNIWSRPVGVSSSLRTLEPVTAGAKLGDNEEKEKEQCQEQGAARRMAMALARNRN